MMEACDRGEDTGEDSDTHIALSTWMSVQGRKNSGEPCKSDVRTTPQDFQRQVSFGLRFGSTKFIVVTVWHRQRC